MIEEAHAQGFESGKAAAEAEIAGRLEEREEHFRNELAAAREAWAQQESGQIAERLVKGLEEIEARVGGDDGAHSAAVPGRGAAAQGDRRTGWRA